MHFPLTIGMDIDLIQRIMEIENYRNDRNVINEHHCTKIVKHSNIPPQHTKKSPSPPPKEKKLAIRSTSPAAATFEFLLNPLDAYLPPSLFLRRGTARTRLPPVSPLSLSPLSRVRNHLEIRGADAHTQIAPPRVTRRMQARTLSSERFMPPQERGRERELNT